MDDAMLNCVLGVCCPPAQQAQALASAMASAGVFASLDAGAVTAAKASHDAHCEAAAAWVLKHFDLAEKGTLKPLRESWKRVQQAR